MNNEIALNTNSSIDAEFSQYYKELSNSKVESNKIISKEIDIYSYYPKQVLLDLDCFYNSEKNESNFFDLKATSVKEERTNVIINILSKYPLLIVQTLNEGEEILLRFKKNDKILIFKSFFNQEDFLCFAQY